MRRGRPVRVAIPPLLALGTFLFFFFRRAIPVPYYETETGGRRLVCYGRTLAYIGSHGMAWHGMMGIIHNTAFLATEPVLHRKEGGGRGEGKADEGLGGAGLG